MQSAVCDPSPTLALHPVNFDKLTIAHLSDFPWNGPLNMRVVWKQFQVMKTRKKEKSIKMGLLMLDRTQLLG